MVSTVVHCCPSTYEIKSTYTYIISPLPSQFVGHASKACFHPSVRDLHHLVFAIVPSHVEPDSGANKESGRCRTFLPPEKIPYIAKLPPCTAIHVSSRNASSHRCSFVSLLAAK